MQRLDIKYEDLHIKSRKYAGLEGFEIRRSNEEIKDETIITIFTSDPQLLSAVDQALKDKYGKGETEQ